MLGPVGEVHYVLNDGALLHRIHVLPVLSPIVVSVPCTLTMWTKNMGKQWLSLTGTDIHKKKGEQLEKLERQCF